MDAKYRRCHLCTTDTLREIAVMLDRFSAIIANFATVQNRTIQKIRVVQQEGNKSWTN